jgi:26S proteasome regulatory subunit N5
VFAGEYGARRLADLKLRVVEHNVLVVSKYYTRITTARLAELLDLKPEEVRVCVCVCVCVPGVRTSTVHESLSAAACLLPRRGCIDTPQSCAPARTTQAEKQLSELVVSKAVAAKIDRPAGLVVIGKPQQPEDVLNGWSRNIGKLLTLVDKSTQQIQKEAMVHKVQLGAAA